MDFIRLADQSRRCFSLGMVAAVPVLGLPAAVEVARLFTAVARETSEPWDHRPFAAGFVGAWALLVAIYATAGLTWAYGFLCLEMVFFGRLFASRVRTKRPRIENPSRRWLYLGLALAYGQVFVLVPVVLWVGSMIQSSLKR